MDGAPALRGGPPCGRLREVETLEGLAQADALLGTAVPLPRVPLPLARWVEVLAHGDDAVEVAWNLDDSRPGTPGRLALYAGRTPPADRQLADATPSVDEGGISRRESPLPEAQPSLRPVQELSWTSGDLHLRLTAQGPWDVQRLLTIARSVAPA